MALVEVNMMVIDAATGAVTYQTVMDEQDDPVPPSPEEYVDICRRAVQSHIDATAQSRLYDSAVSMASYTASTNPAWAAEAQAFVAWRDAVWSLVYALWADPPDPWPTPEQIIAGLPEIVWPA